jgi:hypothetical protein
MQNICSTEHREVNKIELMGNKDIRKVKIYIKVFKKAIMIVQLRFQYNSYSQCFYRFWRPVCSNK